MQIPINPTLFRTDVADFLQKRQGQLKITTSTTSPAGKIVDWVPIESQTTEAIAAPPPTSGAGAPDSAHPTQAVTFDVAPQGPAGHVPILRPDLSKLAAGLQLEDVLSKRGGSTLNKSVRDPGTVNFPGYFHATTQQTVKCYGCEAWLNIWEQKINQPSSNGGDHSIGQTWLQNYDNPKAHWHSLEGGVTTDQSLNGDSEPHLFLFYTTNFYAQEGDNLGGYNQIYKGWVQTHPSIYPGIKLTGYSQQGVSPQRQIGIKFELSGGKWWFGFNTVEGGAWTWLGYYPTSLFSGGIADHASWASFGGEIYSGLKNPCLTTDQMGSGRHAGDGWTHAAYMKLLRTQAAGYVMVNFNGTAEVDVAASNCPNGQFTVSPTMNSGGNWGSYQYYGGPAA
jgi:hypothetical protein